MRSEIKKIYRRIIYSIAFYPVVISVAFILIAFFALYAEDFKMVMSFKEKVPHLIIQDRETARVILATLVGSILSLTVFSFTMVMVVLNQASSNFSPRLLPGLISNKGHQIILGIYIGTLTFCMIILISLGAYGVDSESFGLSTMIAAFLGIFCVGLFVSFINSISKAIQIHNIIDRVAKYTTHELGQKLERKTYIKENALVSEATYALQLKLDRSGYFMGFDVDLVPKRIKELDLQIEILAYEEEYLWIGTPILGLTMNLEKDDIETLQDLLLITTNRDESDSSLGGMIQLMEVAVKAMSPGINDPGTAVNVVRRLGTLLDQALQIPDTVLMTDESFKFKVIGKTISCETLMRTIIQPIRHYSKKDSLVVCELINALKFLEKDAKIPQNKRSIVSRELKALQMDIEMNIENEIDKQHILKLIVG